MWPRILMSTAALALLSGCMTATDNSPKPVALEPIHESVQMHPLWTASTGVGTEGKYLQLTPVSTNQAIYTIDAKGHLQKFSPASGSVELSVDLPYQITGGLGQGEGLLFAGSNEGELIAIAPEDGHVVWTHTLSSEILSRPVVARGLVVTHTADGNLFALDVKTGKEKWVYYGNQPALTLRGTSTPVIADDFVLVGMSSGRIAVFNLLTGDEQLEHPVAVPRGRSELQRLVDIHGEVILDQGLMYAVSYQGNLVAIDTHDGRVVWHRDMSSYRNMDIDSTAIYVTAADSSVWAFDKKTGETLWKQDTLLNRALSAPRVVGNLVVLGDLEGYVHVMSAEHGQLLGRYRVGSGAISTQPLGVGKDVIIVDQQGDVAMLSLHEENSSA